MKKVIVFILLLYSLPMYSQRHTELGGFIGGMYYLGDLNASRHFYGTNFAAGALLRYNFNKRYAVRGSLIFGGLNASDRDFTFGYQRVRNHTFSTPMVDLSVTGEYNFFPYQLGKSKEKFSPYLFGGLNFFIASYATYVYNAGIPFGVGIKTSVSQKIGFGLQWGFTKTFTDYIDNVSNNKTLPGQLNANEAQDFKQAGYFHQRDWYSVFGLTLSIKIIESKTVCNAYRY
jgi:hypothetical protein